MNRPHGLLLAMLLAAAPSNCPADTPSPASAPRPAGAPRLIVLVVVDQLRGGELERLSGAFGDGGFNRLARGGAVFLHAAYSHGVTATGPGHACVISGCNPRINGISANQDAGRECTADPAFAEIGCLPGEPRRNGGSAARLAAPALGALIKEADPAARVVALGLKRRGAVLLAGRTAEAALWWNTQTGCFVTSTAYAPALPRFAAEMNRLRIADRWFNSSWTRLLPDAAYADCAPDDDPAEWDRHGLGRAFPHPINGGLTGPGPAYYEAVLCSPFGNDLLFEAARRAIADL